MKNSSSNKLPFAPVRVPVCRILLIAGMVLSLTLAPVSWASPADDTAAGPNWIDQLLSWVTQWVIGPEDSTESGDEVILLDSTTEAQSTTDDDDDRSPAIDPSGQPAS